MFEEIKSYNGWKTTFALVITALPFIIYGFPQLVGASEAYVVVSGSMSPSIPQGSVIFTENPPINEIEESDVITFRFGESLTTHRVIDKTETNSTIRLKTKGDANEQPDPGFVTRENYRGKVMFSVPYLGYIIQSLGSTIGIILLILVPATIIIFSEIDEIIEELSNGKTNLS